MRNLFSFDGILRVNIKRVTFSWRLISSSAVLIGLPIAFTLFTSSAAAQTTLKPDAPISVGSLTFDDEFNGTTLDSQWSALYPPTGNTMNGVPLSSANVGVGGGYLWLELANSDSGSQVTTNPAVVPGGFTFKTGYVEVRACFSGTGDTIYNWPAIWTVGNNWPYGGETDIAEGTQWLSTNYHSDPANESTNYEVPGNWAGTCNVYGVERASGYNYVYWNGKLVRSYPTNDGNASEWLMLTNVISPDPGTYGSGPYVPGTDLVVDYVRVWSLPTPNLR